MTGLTHPHITATTVYGLAFALVTSMALIASPSWAYGKYWKHTSNTCSKVSRMAFNACRHDVSDDYWINVGNCINTDERHEAKECTWEARDVRGEDHRLCHEQKHARFDICDVIGEEAYEPDIDPANFVTPAEATTNPNPYFPLTPGLVRVLQAGEETITVTVTNETIEILGVTCTVVRDIVEDTVDWYAQDTEGNVWYFGELSKNFENGRLDNLDGSWKAGVEGAQPGIITKAEPASGDVYRQEFALGEAEDMAEVAETDHTNEIVPAADCSAGCLVTREFLPIEPDVEEFKYYAPGIGTILVVDGATGDREELIEVIVP